MQLHPALCMQYAHWKCACCRCEKYSVCMLCFVFHVWISVCSNGPLPQGALCLRAGTANSSDCRLHSPILRCSVQAGSCLLESQSVCLPKKSRQARQRNSTTHHFCSTGSAVACATCAAAKPAKARMPRGHMLVFHTLRARPGLRKLGSSGRALHKET